jgi:hypothetical protein
MTTQHKKTEIQTNLPRRAKLVQDTVPKRPYLFKRRDQNIFELVSCRAVLCWVALRCLDVPVEIETCIEAVPVFWCHISSCLVLLSYLVVVLSCVRLVLRLSCRCLVLSCLALPCLCFCFLFVLVLVVSLSLSLSLVFVLSCGCLVLYQNMDWDQYLHRHASIIAACIFGRVRVKPRQDKTEKTRQLNTRQHEITQDHHKDKGLPSSARGNP